VRRSIQLKPWGYQNYLDSANCDMKTGLDEMGFTPLQSFGFAHNELAARLEEYPHENPLALIGLAVCLSKYESLDELGGDTGFLLELRENLEDQAIEKAIARLEMKDRELFITDMEKVKSLLNW
jgi:hypothetical protein